MWADQPYTACTTLVDLQHFSARKAYDPCQCPRTSLVGPTRQETTLFRIDVPADGRSWAGDMHVRLYEDGTIAVGPVHP